MKWEIGKVNKGQTLTGHSVRYICHKVQGRNPDACVLRHSEAKLALSEQSIGYLGLIKKKRILGGENEEVDSSRLRKRGQKS